MREAELVYKIVDWPFVDGGDDFVKRAHSLRGIQGGVSFIWIPRPIDDTNIRGVEARIGHPVWPMAVDVSYHRLVRTQEWQFRNENCEVLGGQTCFTDGSGLRAVDWLERWTAADQDPDWIRQELVDLYHEVFYETSEPDLMDLPLGETIHLLEQLLEKP